MGFGYKHTMESIEKMRRPRSAGFRLKMVKISRERVHSVETRLKISNSNKGRIYAIPWEVRN